MLTRRTTIGSAAALVGAGVLGRAGAARAGSSVALIGEAQDDDIHVMTYNIRVQHPTTVPGDPDHWSDRAPLVTRLLATERPTLLGVQEATAPQLAAVGAALGGHRMLGFGFGRETLAGYSAIFYDAERFALRAWDQYALSGTPDVVDSTGWGNSFPRSLTWARFTDQRTDRDLTVLTTHLDHQSEYARVASARMVADEVARSDAPVLVAGDFNAAAGASLPYAIVTDGGRLRDTWEVDRARSTDPWGTFPDYGPPVAGERRIDWVLASPGVEVVRAAINTRRFATDLGDRWPSDHTPVQALVRLV